MYDGRIEIWTLLKTVVELGLSGDAETAQAMLSSAGITLPTGDLGDGCFDMQGARYLIPQYCLCDPDNVLEDGAEENVKTDGGHGNGSSSGAVVAIASGSDLPLSSTSDGQDLCAALDQGDEIKLLHGDDDLNGNDEKAQDTLVKLKIRVSSSPPQDLIINVPAFVTPIRVKREIINRVPDLATKSLKLIFLGKLLDDNRAIIEQGWVAEYMLQAFVGS